MTTLLVGVDASDRSRDAIAFARQIAAPARAEILLANVFPYDTLPSRANNAAYARVLEDEATQLVERLRDEAGGDMHTTVLACHSPAHGLHDLAEREEAALVVVGSSHTGAAGRVMPGSTAERLLHGACCPIAIVPKGYAPAEHTLPTIGVAYNASDEAVAALRAAADIARSTGAVLRVIRVLDASSFSSPALMGGPGYDRLAEDLAERPRADLERVVRELELPAEACFLVGTPSHELALQSQTLDLLVTGSRGYGPMRAVLTGGVTGRLLREAACPVIVLPRGVEAPLSGLFADTAASA